MNLVALAIVGLGIGVLAGISASPVLAVVLTSVMAVAAAATTLLADIAVRNAPEDERRRAVSLWPVTMLVLGIVIGAFGGGWARTTYALDRIVYAWTHVAYTPSEGIAEAIDAWVALGLERGRVVDEIFAAQLGVVGSTTLAMVEEQASATVTGLFASSAEECASLEAARILGERDLRARLEVARDPAIKPLTAVLENEELPLLLAVICPEDKP